VISILISVCLLAIGVCVGHVVGFLRGHKHGWYACYDEYGPKYELGALLDKCDKNNPHKEDLTEAGE